jgi:hypothetical protein
VWRLGFFFQASKCTATQAALSQLATRPWIRFEAPPFSVYHLAANWKTGE